MKEISKLALLLPLALFVGAVVVDMNIITGALKAGSSIYMREIFIIVALILSVPLVYLQKWASDRNVLRGLRSLFFLIIFTCLLLLFSQDRLDVINKSIGSDLAIYDNLSFYVLLLSWAFFMTVFILIILGTLRNLVFIKRKKSTARNFNWFLLLLLLYPLLNFARNYSYRLFYIGPETFKIISYVILFLLIYLMVLNSFRVSWINYLNKKQKLACFWGGILLLPVQIYFAAKFHAIDPISLYSPVLATFVEYGIAFLTIYLVIAFLALIAHLPTAQLYDRKMNQISSLHHLSRAVSSEFDSEKLVVTIVKLAVQVTEADFSWLELVDPETEKIKLVSFFNLNASEKNRFDPALEDSLQDWLGSHGDTFLSNQVQKSHASKALRNWKRDLNSLLAVSLRTGDKDIGYLYVGKRVEFGFEQDDTDMLRAFCQQAVIAVENARLVKASIIKERLEQELKVAHDAQMKLLPKEMPQLEGFAIEAVCITANEVGGDYFDFFRLSKDKVGVIIGDVSGKGASAAFYMAEIKGIMGALARGNRSPKKILAAANKTLYEDLDSQTFITVVCGILDARDRSFTFCRAGHCPVYVAEDNSSECKVLEPSGIGLGLDGGSIFEKSLKEVKLKLKPGSACLLFTDGVIEARNREGEEFGEEMLQKAFVGSKDLHPSKIKKTLIKEIDAFVDGYKAHDDLSFVIIKAV
ncbi:MAG: SpoIIE family protein phosphatase [Calditrichaeota bacterium]|nr:SpoIIE family protein phosphatase [Calditrichota bacterium]